MQSFCFVLVALINKSIDCGLEVDEGMDDAAF